MTGTPSTSAKICGQSRLRDPPPESTASLNIGTGLADRLDMLAMTEGNAFEQGPHKVTLGVPAGNAVETGARMAVLLGAIKIGMIKRIVRRRRHCRGHARKHASKGETPSGVVAFEELPHQPFEIGGRGGAVFHRHVAVTIEGRRHEDRPIEIRDRR